MNLRTSRPRALLFLAAAALAGCVAAEGQPETPDGELSDTARSGEMRRPGSKRRPGLEAGAAGGNPWVSCYGSFQPSLDPALDLQRLADACAVPAGQSAITQVHVGDPQTEEASTERLTFLGRAGRCYRVFSIGAPGVADLDVAILDDRGQIAAADVSADRWPIVPTSGPLCLRKDVQLTIHAAVVQGNGSYLMQVWGNSMK